MRELRSFIAVCSLKGFLPILAKLFFVFFLIDLEAEVFAENFFYEFQVFLEIIETTKQTRKQ